MSGPLAGQTVIITGASRGIGKAIALRFARGGADVVLCAQTAATLNGVAAEVQTLGGRALAVAADVRDEMQVDRCVRQALDAFGSVDILVNSAGVSRPAPFVETELQTWHLMMETNVTGTFLFTKAIVPHMLRRGHGLILNVGSRSGQEGFARYAGYCASKFAVMGLTQSLAKELGGQGIRVNVICPGEVDTDMNRASHPGIRDTSGWLQPGAIADVAFFLACPEGRSIHGASINVYGQSIKAG
jgi:NAD(P)-dependent dehydrogenase (short-subunit alcohol dehydrogenase family)